MIIYSVMLLFPFLILAKTGDESISNLLPFEKVGGRVTALLVLAGVGICMSLNIQTSMMLTIGEIVGIHIPLPESPYENTVSYIIVSVLTTALLPALEEIRFPGRILGSLRRFGDGFAVIISAMLFGITHFYITQIPMAFILGLVMGFIVVKTNSLLPGILIHFLTIFLPQELTRFPIIFLRSFIFLFFMWLPIFCWELESFVC